MNEAFQFSCHVSINYVSKAICSQAEFTLKLMRYGPNDYNNEERHRERIEWYQKFLELGGIMADLGLNLHLTH